MAVEQVQKKPGSIFGGMLLIAGSCIGAGMLALPILTGLAGFFPTLIMFVIAWLFMTVTAILLVEVNSWFDKPVNFTSMIGRTLGKTGKALSWLLYLFLFYSLGVAYLSLSGDHFSSFFHDALHITVPDWSGSLIFTILFGWIVFLGTRPVDLVNRWLMLFKIVAYITLIVIGMKYVNTSLLTYKNSKYAFFSLPVLIISFGFHNMIPSLNHYMKGDVKRVKKAILAGSIFTFFVYIIWEIVALGILPIQGDNGILSSFKEDIGAAQALRNFLGLDAVGISAQFLAFFAILTSFLAQTLSLVHFLGDGLKIKGEKKENVGLCLLALVPPLILSIAFPQILFKALNFAGGFCAVILFGIFPALMVWIGRYRHKIPSNYRTVGGQPLLIAILVVAVLIVFYQISTMLGVHFLPTP